jgi:hypothetical protein
VDFSSVARPRGGGPEYVELEGCYVHRTTARAVLVTYEGEEHWIPKSVIREPDGLARWQEDVDIEVQEWFARKEAII